MSEPERAPRLLGPVAPAALLLGAVALAATAIGLWQNPREAWPGYLCAWTFWLGISVGSLVWLMIHHLMRAGWGRAIQRPAESAASNVPLMTVLFIPIATGLRWLYPWMNHDLVHQIGVLTHRAPFMNAPFFLARAAIFLLLWYTMAWALSHRFTAFSAPGLVLCFLAMTAASIDWLMSLDVYFYSTIFGFLVTVQQGLAALAFLILALCILVRYEPLRGHVTPEIFNDLGSLLETTLILWAYMMFSQFLVLWMGNTQDDLSWWTQRLSAGWGWVSAALVVLQFFIPFFLLLMRPVKRDPRILGTVAALLLFMTVIDSWWFVAPSGPHPTPPLRGHWTYITATLGIGGLWTAAFLRRLQRLGLLAPEQPDTLNGVPHEPHPARP